MFTVSKTRGRFARLCVQIDVKLLITTVIIRKLEQPVSYERIHKLCFGCGRMGHRKERCSYITRQEPLSKEARMEVVDGVGARSHEDCDPISPRTDVGPSGEVHETVQEIVHEGTYGPWVMVARRKNETKTQRSGGSPPGQKNVMIGNFNGNFDIEEVDRQGVGRAEITNGPVRESKRKLSPPRILDRAQLENLIQKIGKEVTKQA